MILIALLEKLQTFPIIGAGSTGRCNTFTQLIRWGHKAQGFSGSLVQSQRYAIQVGLRVPREIRSSGKYWRSNRLVFSLVPRCQGLWGSQK